MEAFVHARDSRRMPHIYSTFSFIAVVIDYMDMGKIVLTQNKMRKELQEEHCYHRRPGSV